MNLIRFVLLWSMVANVHASNLTIAEQEKQYKDHLSWAKGAQQTTPSKLDVSDYCADTQCINQVHNPPQKGMSDSAINNKKTAEFYSNDTAKAVQDNFNKGRSDVENDPDYEFALIGQEHAYDISHGLSNPYVDCNTGTQCLAEQTTKTCKVSTNAQVSCHETPFVKEQIETSGSVSFTHYGFTPITYQLPEGVTTITGIDFPKVLTCQGLMCFANKGVFFRVNSTIVHSEPYDPSKYPSNSEKVRCTSGGTGKWCFANYAPFTKRFALPASKNVLIDFDNDFGLFEGKFTIHFKQKKNVMAWRSTCSSLLPECKQTQRICVEAGETRTINGVPTYLSCWKYQLNHKCDVGNTCDALASCTENSRSCSLKLNGICIQESVSKTCEVKNCIQTDMQCGEVSFCLDGDCYDATPQRSNDFNKAASNLAALNEAAEGLGNPPKIFTGKAMRCTDKAFGFADCCKDGGWGTSIGLAECSEEEKALGQAKEQGITIYLGSYCASEVLGSCTRRKKTYCTFDSKLARIVQEQGVRKQLGISLGSAKNPVCGAITPEQLQNIDFEYIDFSDFYSDMHDNADLPSSKEIQDRLQSAYGG